jgi:hypothetical protein
MRNGGVCHRHPLFLVLSVICFAVFFLGCYFLVPLRADIILARTERVARSAGEIPIQV